MEHDIGCKIKAARIEKKLTQEQVAELLGVSRQTISNWENEKSYPDIISVIKMSECYDVSLDYLLKGEQKMKSYYDYLEESTNVVKSNANRNKIITILSYLLIWAFAMIVFWFFTSGSDAMGYSLMFLWFILPISTFIVSIVIGKNNFWGKGKWAFTLFFGVMYMLAEYGTFKMANNIAFNKLNAPDLGMIVAGAIISAIGMLVGSLWNALVHMEQQNVAERSVLNVRHHKLGTAGSLCFLLGDCRETASQMVQHIQPPDGAGDKQKRQQQRAARERGDGYNNAYEDACAVPNGIVRFHCRLPSFHKNKKGLHQVSILNT